MTLTTNERWILLYGGYRVSENIDVANLNKARAIKAEAKAYEDLTFNDGLLRQYGYRERRLDINAHVSLREKLNSLP